MRSIVPIAAALALAGCSGSPFDPPEVAACEAFTKHLLSEPSGYRRSSFVVQDETLSPGDYRKRAGFPPAGSESAKLGRMTIDLAQDSARRDGGKGQLGLRSVLLKFEGGGTSDDIPPGTNACWFRTIDGTLPSRAELDGAVERALGNRTLRQAGALLGDGKVRAFEPDVPCCLVP